MKYLLLFLTFILCNGLQAVEADPLITFSSEELIKVLDKGNLKEAEAIYKKSVMKNINLLFITRDLLQSRYGAKKVYEKDNLIILDGNPWIRNGNSLIETMHKGNSVIKIHKKTMQIVYIQGNFIQTHLLK